MSSFTPWLRLAAATIALTVLPNIGRAADYKDADAAYRDGTSKLKQMQYDEARTALEAALQLALDDEFRLKTNQALVQVYRRLPEAGPMIAAQEFVIRQSPQRNERALAARSLTSFLFQRGLLERQIEQWEARLKQDAGDIVALSTLTAVYGGLKRDKDRRDELSERLTKLEQGRSAKLAEDLEKRVAAEPQRAALLWKDAAVGWRDAAQKDKAIAAADEAERAGPPASGILLHFYHRQLGEVYADCGKPAKAIAHLEKAIAATAIKGYQDDCRARIDKLRNLQVP